MDLSKSSKSTDLPLKYGLIRSDILLHLSDWLIYYCYTCTVFSQVISHCSDCTNWFGTFHHTDQNQNPKFQKRSVSVIIVPPHTPPLERKLTKQSFLNVARRKFLCRMYQFVNHGWPDRTGSLSGWSLRGEYTPAVSWINQRWYGWSASKIPSTEESPPSEGPLSSPWFPKALWAHPVPSGWI